MLFAWYYSNTVITDDLNFRNIDPVSRSTPDTNTLCPGNNWTTIIAIIHQKRVRFAWKFRRESFETNKLDMTYYFRKTKDNISLY